jgi:hypothetical protein
MRKRLRQREPARYQQQEQKQVDSRSGQDVRVSHMINPGDEAQVYPAVRGYIAYSFSKAIVKAHHEPEPRCRNAPAAHRKSISTARRQKASDIFEAVSQRSFCSGLLSKSASEERPFKRFVL